ncbi:fimbria/pilus periplasmic chaperone [Enterobacter kobei]|nr:fimbria/pilus periplasmic chaperone [Enterobacter kobei]
MKNTNIQACLLAGLLCTSFFTFASGMKPATSVVLVDAGKGEYSMVVENTDATPALLYTSLQNIDEDKEKLLLVTPPVARVEAGGSQLVRFIMQTHEPLKTQRLMRVFFEGIPQAAAKGKNTLGVNVRQNLPVIISPPELINERQPWKYLTASVCNGQLRINNDSPYVVRLAQAGTALPASSKFQLPKTYILPQTRVSVQVKSTAGITSVRVHPASVYGFAVKHFDVAITACEK